MKWSIVLVLSLFNISTRSIEFEGDKLDKTYDLRLAPQLFKEFQTHYKRNYSASEMEHRSKVFYDNLVKMNAINENFPGSWFAVIGPYADLTYLEYVKMRNLTEANYTDVGSRFRNVINCTDRLGYLYERFSDTVRDDYEASHDPEYYDDDEYESGTKNHDAKNATDDAYHDDDTTTDQVESTTVPVEMTTVPGDTTPGTKSEKT